ncbi:hypothetical protein NGTWS1803_22650 [Mycolicibacterium cyprinidarum]|nr:hypothetical protein NGTWS1803_22650 [Mycolicibacterium sp. NGTWS1803]
MLRNGTVRSLAQGTQVIRAHETEVDCFYNVINEPDGERLLHLSTFGSDYRQSRPKSSQSIQIGEDIARELISLLEATFPGVRNQPRQ